MGRCRRNHRHRMRRNGAVRCRWSLYPWPDGDGARRRLGAQHQGSYAEQVCVPATNVVAVDSDLSWEDLAAIPESYATAWTGLMGILGLGKDQIVAIRGATSALGQAAVNIAKHIGARVIATTRNSSRAAMLDALGVNEVLVESPELANRVRERHPQGIDAHSTSSATPGARLARHAQARRPCL